MRHFLLILSLCCALLGCDVSKPIWGPKPPPVPPAPHVEPITQGLRVLIIHESGDKPTATRGQLSILSSTKVNEYLSDHCKFGWRKLDQNSLAGVWKELATAAKPGKLPWLIIADGERIVFNDSLPADVDSFLSLMGQFNG